MLRNGASDGLLQTTVENLVGLGIPGFIAVVIAHTGCFGAPACTSALATLGDPWGMLVGIGVLGLSVLVSKALTAFGLTQLARSVVRGRVAKGESWVRIRVSIDRIPRWIVSEDLRRRLYEALDESC